MSNINGERFIIMVDNMKAQLKFVKKIKKSPTWDTVTWRYIEATPILINENSDVIEELKTFWFIPRDERWINDEVVEAINSYHDDGTDTLARCIYEFFADGGSIIVESEVYKRIIATILQVYDPIVEKTYSMVVSKNKHNEDVLLARLDEIASH